MQKLYLSKKFPTYYTYDIHTQDATKFKLYIQFLGPPLPVPRVVDLSHALTNLIFLPFGFEGFFCWYIINSTNLHILNTIAVGQKWVFVLEWLMFKKVQMLENSKFLKTITVGDLLPLKKIKY